jgi:integrase
VAITVNKKITKTAVDALTPDPVQDTYLRDTDLEGFYVRMYAKTGAASYYFGARLTTGKYRPIKIGVVGGLTPDEARKAARAHRAEVDKGADPVDAKFRAREAWPIAKLCDEYLTAAEAGLVSTRFGRPKRASTIKIDRGSIARHVKPLIGSEVAAKFTSQAAQRFLDDIAKGKTAVTEKNPNGRKRARAVVKGGSGAASRVVELMGGVWSWAQKRGHIPAGANPFHGLQRVKGKGKDRVFSPLELKALGAVLVANEDLEPEAVAAVRIIAFNGLRLSEAVGLRRDEIDARGRALRFHEVKAGVAMRALSAEALAVIEDVPVPKPAKGEAASPFLFPATRGNGPADLKKRIAALFNAAGLTDAKGQVLRRSFATCADELGYSDAVVGTLIGHAKKGTTQKFYVRRPDAVLLKAMDRTAAVMAARMDGKSAEIVDHPNADRADG